MGMAMKRMKGTFVCMWWKGLFAITATGYLLLDCELFEPGRFCYMHCCLRMSSGFAATR